MELEVWPALRAIPFRPIAFWSSQFRRYNRENFLDYPAPLQRFPILLKQDRFSSAILVTRWIDPSRTMYVFIMSINHPFLSVFLNYI